MTHEHTSSETMSVRDTFRAKKFIIFVAFLTNHTRPKGQYPVIYLITAEISELLLHFPPSHRTQLKSDD